MMGSASDAAEMRQTIEGSYEMAMDGRFAFREGDPVPDDYEDNADLVAAYMHTQYLRAIQVRNPKP